MNQTLQQGIPTVNQPVQVPVGFANQQPVAQQAPVPQQAPAQPVAQQQGTTILTPQQVEQLMAQLQPQVMSNPVKITQPSYLITEEQMKYVLSLASGNPQQVAFMNQPSKDPMGTAPQQCVAMQGQAGNLFDGVANATLGTVGRVGHTLTGLVDSIIDIFTLGYGGGR